MEKQKKYEIYHIITGEVLSCGFNDFTAICNMASLKQTYGDYIEIRWI